MAIKKQTRRKIYISLGLIAILALLVLIFFSGENFELAKSLFDGNLSQDALKDKLRGFGWRGYITISILSMLQVVFTFLPSEPAQALGGAVFGFARGFLCCLVGVIAGNTAIYLLHKTFGNRLRQYFVSKLHLDFEKIAKSSKWFVILFILYFLPALPYGMIAFFAASIGIKYWRYILITTIGAIPSICIGVGFGHVAVSYSWVVSVCVIAALLILLTVSIIKRDTLIDKINQYADKHKGLSKNSVQNVNGFVMGVVYYALRLYYFLCGVRVKAVNKIGELEKPSIVLCNHGSFIDFIFAATLLRKFKPNFIIARLYFYDNRLRWLLKTVGGFPKSMFAMDAESTKNCLRVLRSNGILAMMPEARLSTTGRFEDIQESTYAFIKKTGVPVYTVKFSGDYFADPKWGKGFRRGSLVEVELDALLTAEELKSISVEEIKQGVEKRLNYNEFEWLKQRPDIKYKSRRMAEGLENILSVCPVCKQKHTITTKKNKVFCEKCGYLTSLDNRYQFDKDFVFSDLTKWYDWQKSLIEDEIAQNDAFELVSHVELRLPGNGKGLTRHGGNGVCRLNRQGLFYEGTKDGEEVQLHFSFNEVYRLLFGAGENFEIYVGTEIFYFVPAERRSAIDWYVVSMILHDQAIEQNT